MMSQEVASTFDMQRGCRCSMWIPSGCAYSGTALTLNYGFRPSHIQRGLARENRLDLHNLRVPILLLYQFVDQRLFVQFRHFIDALLVLLLLHFNHLVPRLVVVPAAFDRWLHLLHLDRFA